MMRAARLRVRSNPGGRLWTEEENRRLAELYGVLSDDKIAKMLRRTVSSVKTQASKLGLEVSYHGMSSIHQISQKTGVNWSTVLNVLKVAGVRPTMERGKHRLYDDFLAEETIKTYLDSYTPTDLEREIGYSRKFLAKLVDAYEPVQWLWKHFGRVDDDTAQRMKRGVIEYMSRPTPTRLATETLHVHPSRVKKAILSLGWEYDGERRLGDAEIEAIRRFLGK